MAALSLIAKRLAKKPIGTYVDVTWLDAGDVLKQISGVIIDSDFATGVEIEAADGNAVAIDLTLVKSLTETKSLTQVLQGLQPGTKIRYAKAGSEDLTPVIAAIVEDNDGFESLELTVGGKETLESYSLIASLLVVGGAAPEQEQTNVPENKPVQQFVQVEDPKPAKPAKPTEVPLYERKPEGVINASDPELKSLFDSLPMGERKKLSGCYDSFKYGLKINDRDKIADAARQAAKILTHEYNECEYDWTSNAARFCGLMLRRTNVYDSEVFLIGECFWEAALVFHREQDYTMCGAHALLALMDPDVEPDRIEDLLIMIATGIAKEDDISGLRILQQRCGGKLESQIRTLIRAACTNKGLQLTAEQTISDSLNMLEALYPNSEIGEEVKYWLPQAPAPAPKSPVVAPAPKPESKTEYGVISYLNWSGDKSGTITAESGEKYRFELNDVADKTLHKQLRESLSATLDGKTVRVRFKAERGVARNVETDDALVDRARAVAADSTLPDRFFRAYELCALALGTSDGRRAINDVVSNTIPIFKNDNTQTALLERTLSLYEQYRELYPRNSFSVMNLAQCYGYAKRYPQMLQLATESISFEGLTAKQMIAQLSNYLRMVREYYEHSKEKALLHNMLDVIKGLQERYSKEFAFEQQIQYIFRLVILPYRVYAECHLDMLAEAEEDYAAVAENNNFKPLLTDLIGKLRARAAAAGQTVEAPAAEEVKPQSQPQPQPEIPDAPKTPEPQAEPEPEVVEPEIDPSIYEEEEQEPVKPYEDKGGWEALKTTKQAVADYALAITGEDRIPYILTYLKAASDLNKALKPLYHTVALAANDPQDPRDYSLTALIDALAESDSAYPMLNDCCMAAAFLRSSFSSGRGYDYAAQGLRQSISITADIPALDAVYDILEEFRKEVGQSMDIYADYRNHGTRKLREDLEAVKRRASELYQRFVLTPPRENANFVRLLETKKIVFDRNGYLATMLNLVQEGNTQELEARKEEFVEKFLGGVNRFASNRISVMVLDSMFADAWEQTGKNAPVRRNSSNLQGNLRSNLRSNISDILGVVCQWYELSEQGDGLAWRTADGEACYNRLRPKLMEALSKVRSGCAMEMMHSDSPDYTTGLFLLSDAAKEMHSRLDGSWRFEQGKEMFRCFLSNDQVLLKEDGLPDLSSTFCALPRFNILERIRSHVEGPKLEPGEHIARIYGMEKAYNNYGIAHQILEHLHAQGKPDPQELPQNAQRFVAQTRTQIEMRYRSFAEKYALANNYGQIMASDHFCYTLMDTVRYWYAESERTRNYGFFQSLLLHAENQIHASAQQYEAQLNEQLEALVASAPKSFEEYPDCEAAIRNQISDQNFLVAEDWMRRVKAGDFSLEISQPEALKYLEHFWHNYVYNYDRVSDGNRPLRSLVGRRMNADDPTQQLVDCWPVNADMGADEEQIQNLLSLLGWSDMKATACQFGDVELYEVHRERTTVAPTVPLHPIAAFGSELDKPGKRMYVACLYGSYGSERLYDKMRELDSLDGDKIILLDCAIGGADRRALARELKKRGKSLNSICIVIDRVLLSHLSNIYESKTINRILMALAMPFTYCQPYVADSAQTMPPEIFIGRQEELQKIKAADGVNLIYGGRQLGKSALLKKALLDLDRNQGRRAVLVDIKDCDCAAAARKLSMELIDQGILAEEQLTDDWELLCRAIKQRLRSTDNPIRYLLIMLDEADCFITDCAKCNYKPLVELKDVQQSMTGQFKHVLAGLHDIVKFNREVALGNNSVITHFPSLKITPFRSPEAQQLLTEPLSYLGFSLPSNVTVSQILATVNYFPGLIQLYCQNLIESMRAPDYAGYDQKKTPPYVVTDEHISRVMADKEFADQIRYKFEITLTLDQDQGSYYYPLTLLIGLLYNAEPSKSGYTAGDILRHAKDLAIYPLAGLNEEKVDALLQELQDLNILRSVSNDSYLLASKNFRDLLGSEEEILDKLTKVEVTA